MKDNYIVLVFDSYENLKHFKNEFAHRLLNMVVFEDIYNCNLLIDEEDFNNYFAHIETMEEFNYCIKSLNWVFGNE